MLHVLIDTILPIFSIILLGCFLNLKRMIDPGYIRTANQIIFYVAIPALLLKEISQAPFRENFSVLAVVCALGAMSLTVLFSVFCMKQLKIAAVRQATFLQSSFHGNIGYLSYAIAYYTLGETHFARLAILSSFVMLAQNLFAVWALTTYGIKEFTGGKRWVIPRQVLSNPIIITVALGMGYSALGFTLPLPLRKGLDILGGMAFPTALLLIGASLSFGSFRSMVKEIMGIGFLKLICLPLIGLALMRAAHLPESLILPGIILLAAPPATITYVMATELGGDPELAATSISIHTLVSALTYTVILSAFVP
ncbi:MAG: AEC family transporter [Deltaproteobacteria bacterium]|nr:AEC family transporter [Deltaproteobacteria bacterium]